MDPLILQRGMVLSGSIEDYPGGIVIPVDKPWRWTSADVIRRVKWAACKHFGNKHLKVGHAGTLDPLATGVLLVCIGKATKLADTLQAHEKEYVAGVVFGATTPSYDREKEIDRHYSLEGVSEAALRDALPSFLGEQEQVAPLFSAKSVDGVRAYEMARKAYKAAQRGEGTFDHGATELLTRQRICISELELLEWGDGQLCKGRSAGEVDSGAGEGWYHPVVGGGDDDANAAIHCIAYSVAHPNEYIAKSNRNNDWLIEPNQRYLWGINWEVDGNIDFQPFKTVYDPCPKGYAVATPNCLAKGLEANTKADDGSLTLFGGKLYVPGSSFIYNGGYGWWDGADGHWAGLWTCSTSWGNTENAFRLNSNGDARDNYDRAVGLPVRCVKFN